MVGKLTDDRQASASRIPAIMGISPYSTPNKELQASLDAIDGVGEAWDGNEATRWGNRLEPVILQEACERVGLDNYDLDITEAYHHPKLPLSASLDGIANVVEKTIEHDPSSGIYVVGADKVTVRGPGVLESKLTSVRPDDDPPLWRGPVQMQAQMMCAGSTWGMLAVLHQGIELRCYIFTAHVGTQTKISEAVQDFDRRLKERDYYPVETNADANIVFRYADESEPPIELPEMVDDVSVADLLSSYHDADRAIKAAEQIKEDVSAVIKTLMGNRTEAFLGTYKIKWPMRHYKAQPEKITPAKAARSVRQSTIKVEQTFDE